MDKYVEALCKQNPKMKLECKNPECKHEVEVNSKDVFKSNEYILTCPKCGNETSYDSTKFADDFKKQLKQMGVTLK